MTAIIVLFALLIVLGIASALGKSVDTRDPDYDLAELYRGVDPWAAL